jgi:hypothetical protein
MQVRRCKSEDASQKLRSQIAEVKAKTKEHGRSAIPVDSAALGFIFPVVPVGFTSAICLLPSDF